MEQENNGSAGHIMMMKICRVNHLSGTKLNTKTTVQRSLKDKE